MRIELLLAFAAGALFLIGNNVFADDPGESEEPIEIGGPTITCHQHALPGRANLCWRKYTNWGWRPITDQCYWTGYYMDMCVL